MTFWFAIVPVFDRFNFIALIQAHIKFSRLTPAKVIRERHYSFGWRIQTEMRIVSTLPDSNASIGKIHSSG
jgi:hypothetical protein